MSEINPINISNQQNNLPAIQEINIKPENIDSVYATEKLEQDRTKFNESFFELPLNNENAQGAKAFYSGLINNKESLCQDLNLTSEEYDALSCVAMALASQETGMGFEERYDKENNGSIVDIGRDIGIIFKNLIGKKGSASSGLTQMKVYDLVSGQDGKIKVLFEKYGIKAKNKISNNLYENPDKAAAATMIMLSELADENYNQYKSILSNSHNEIRGNLDPTLSDEECINIGLEILTAIQDAYKDMRPSKQEKLRNGFKDWLLSYNGFENTKEYKAQHPEQNKKKYFEDENLKKFNKLLKKSDIQLTQNSLDYIRYALTAPGAEMTNSQYCIYAWNKGAGGMGYQLDRLLSEKLGEFFPSDNLDYDLYTYNTESLLEHYAQKSGVDIDTLNYVLNNYADR